MSKNPCRLIITYGEGKGSRGIQSVPNKDSTEDRWLPCRHHVPAPRRIPRKALSRAEMACDADLRNPIFGSAILGPDMQRAVVATADYDAAQRIDQASGKPMTCWTAYNAEFGLRARVSFIPFQVPVATHSPCLPRVPCDRLRGSTKPESCLLMHSEALALDACQRNQFPSLVHSKRITHTLFRYTLLPTNAQNPVVMSRQHRLEFQYKFARPGAVNARIVSIM